MNETICYMLVCMLLATCVSASCPSGCVCESFKGKKEAAKLRVKCSGLKLTTIPDGIPPETNELVLEDNHITTLSKNAFGTQTLANLDSLVLRQNGLTSIAIDAFLVSGTSDTAATPHLSSLDLSNNKLPSIPELPCDLMPRLSSLDLHNNAFKSAKFPDSYAKCSVLSHITMTSNHDINSLAKDDFQNLKAKNLRLEIGNSVSAIDPDAFAPVKPVITMLGLSENPIGFNDLKNTLTALNETTSLNSLHLNTLRGADLNGTIFALLESFSAPNLKAVSISSNPVYALGGSFSGDVNSLSVFECESCRLESVGGDVFKSTSKLIRVMLQRNRLTSVPATLPSSLQFLSLDNNPITKVSAADFSGYSDLLELSLGSTTLESVAIDTFSGLNKLNKLVFVNTSLTESALVSSGKSLFAGLAALKTLSLSGNAIAQLNDAALFKGLEKLTSLALDAQRTADHMGLTAIDASVFAPLGAALTALSLSGNAGFGSKQVQIDTDGALLRSIAKLASLALDGCGISNIPQAYFSNVSSSLTTLSLSRNAIPVEVLSDGPLAALTNLKKLHISNCSLQYVPAKAFAQWPQLQEVDLRHNPFNCDAKLQELHDWLQAATQNFSAPDAQSPSYAPSATQKLVIGYRSYVCASPPACVGVHIADAAFSTHLAQCTSGTADPAEPNTTSSNSIIGTPGPAYVWLVVLVACVVVVLGVATGWFTGRWFWRRRRAGYSPINAPITA